MRMISHEQLALKRSQYAGQLIRLPHRPLPSALHPLFLQIIKVQEDPSNIPEGETPRSLLMYAFDTNVDACKPGDKVTCTGEGLPFNGTASCWQLASRLLFRSYMWPLGAFIQSKEVAARAGRTDAPADA